MAIENDPIEPDSTGIYIAPEESFISYWHGLSASKRQMYIAIQADLVLANKDFLDLKVSRDELIAYLNKVGEHILTLRP